MSPDDSKEVQPALSKEEWETKTAADEDWGDDDSPMSYRLHISLDPLNGIHINAGFGQALYLRQRRFAWSYRGRDKGLVSEGKLP